MVKYHFKQEEELMTNMIVSMSLDYGRCGKVKGVFLVSKEDFELAKKLNPQVYFGEILGKHSEVYCDFNEISFEVKTEDQEKVNALIEMDMHSSGYDPFEYLEMHSPEWREGEVNKVG